MAVLKNRAKMSTSATGTGSPITLGSAEDGYQTFADAGVANADVVRYVIEDGNNWEIGTGTYTSSGATLSRTVSESSNSDAAINLSGSATVFIGATAEDVFQGELFAENPSSPTAPSATGTNAVAIGSGVTASGYGSFAAGNASTASGSDSIVLGSTNTASGTHSFALGGGSATASGARSISIGYASDAASNEATAVGRTAQARNTSANAFGRDSYSAGNQSTAIGDSYASGADSFAAAIANNTSSYGATGANSISIGYQSKSTGTKAVSIGDTVTASGTRSTAQGYLSTASATYSHVTGRGNTSSGNYSSVWGGFSSTASGSNSSIINGFSSIAAQNYSTAIGPYSTTRAQYAFALGGHSFGAQGAGQSSTFNLISDTTDATSEAMTTNNASAGTLNQIILPNNSAYSFSGTIIARESAAAGSDYASWEIKGALLRDANAASTVLGNGIQNKLYATSGASAWAIALSADTTNGGLKIEVTGAASTNIRWVATVNTSEVTYA